MKKILIYALLAAFPFFLHSINEKECKKYLDSSDAHYLSAHAEAKKISCQSVEIKIDLFNSALQFCHLAVVDLDVILDDIHGKNPHKLRPWHIEAKDAAKRRKDECFRFSDLLQKNLICLKLSSSFENKQKEYQKRISEISEKTSNIHTLPGFDKIEVLSEVINKFPETILPLQEILTEIATIENLDIFEKFRHFKNQVLGELNSQQKVFEDLKLKNDEFCIHEIIVKFYNGCKLKCEQAKAKLNGTHPANLKDMTEFSGKIEEVIDIYESALEDCKLALEKLDSIPSSPDFHNFKVQEMQLKSLIADCKTRIELTHIDHKQILLDHFLILEKIDCNLATKKKVEALLKELSSVDEDFLKDLEAIRIEIIALEIDENGVKDELAPANSFNFQDEDIALNQFFKTRNLSLLNRNDAKNINNPESSYAIGLDNQYEPIQNEYLLYLDQFYHFYIQEEFLTHINVDVIKNGEVIYRERVELPLPDKNNWQNSWNEFSTENCFILTSKKMMSDFNIDLQFLPIYADDNKYKLVIKQKVTNDLYELALLNDDRFLYQCRFISAPPWQLDILKLACLATIEKPLEKLDIYYTGNCPLKEKELSPEWASDQILDQFIEEMRRDPLLIAQYVQNEIDFVDPYCLDHDGTFKAAPIQRNTLCTFLEKQGSAWEQCALLVYLLKKAGFQAIYAQGPILNLRACDAEKLLSKQFLESHVKFHYPWVMFFDGNRWITLFPWLKDIAFSEGHQIYDFLPQDYSSGEKWIKRYLTNDLKILKAIGPDGDDTAGTLFVRFIEEELKAKGLSKQNVGFQRRIKKKQLTQWQDFPRLLVNEDFNTATELGSYPTLFTKVLIEIFSLENPLKKISSKEEYISSISTDFPSIHFDEIDPTKQVLNLVIGKNVNQLNLDHTDSNLQVKVTYQYLEKVLSQVFTLAKGTAAAICFNSGGSNTKMTSFFANQFSNATENNSKLRSLLTFMGALYFEKCSANESDLASIHKLSPSTILNFGLAKLSPGITKEQQNSTFPQLDMFQFQWKRKTSIPFSFHQDMSLAQRSLSAIMCAVFSSNEHRVLKEIFDDPYAVSTVKLLQIAHENHQKLGGKGVGFLTFTPQNLSDAETFPILAQCLYCNHIEGINLSKIKADAKDQWTIMKTSFQCKENPFDQSFSYAYMTPGPVSSKDGNLLQPPSYTGMGTLIIHNSGSYSLISNGSTVMNGGYGSRLPTNTIKSITNEDWKITQTNQKFSLVPPDRGFKHLSENCKDVYFGNTGSLIINNKIPESINFSENNTLSLNRDKLKTDFKSREFVCLDNPFVTSKFRSDIRGGHKSIYHMISDPVDIVTGAFYIDEVDIDLPGPFPLAIRRNYNNQSPLDGLLGIGWKISLNPKLFEQDEHLFVAEEDGSVINYRFCADTNCWKIFPEDNLELSSDNKKGIGGTTNPYHGYIEKKEENYILHASDGSLRIFKNNLLKKWINPSGHFLHFYYESEKLNRIESSNGAYLGFCYNHEGRISEVYSIDGRRVYYNYDSESNLIKVELPDGGKIAYEYDDFHQLTKEINPCGKILENIYDSEKRVIEQRTPSGYKQQMVTSAIFSYENNIHVATDAVGGSTKYKIFEKQIYKITDPEGFETFQSRFIDANTWFDAETEEIKTYFGKGSYPKSIKSIKDKRGLVTEYFYDDDGNPIEIRLKGDDLTGFGDQVSVQYFAYNENHLQTSKHFLDRKTLTTYHEDYPYLPKRIEEFIKGNLVNYSEYQYDSHGQLIAEDKDGAITLWEYDNKGFPFKKTQKTGTHDPDVITCFRHNHQGQCIELVTSDSIVRTDYDIVGNPILSSIYDLSGNLLSTSHAGFDFNHMLIWKMGSDPNDVTYIDYNLSGLAKASRQPLFKAVMNNDGCVDVATDGTAYTLYDYDFAGRLVREVDPLGRLTYREYDLLGRPIKVTNHEYIKFSYEAGGLISEVETFDGLKTSRKFGKNGLIFEEIYPDGSQCFFKYDLLGRCIYESKDLITITTEYDDAARKVIKKRNGELFSVEEFDSQNNVILKSDGVGNCWRKSYDKLGRLIEEVSPTNEITAWEYDGNRVLTTYPSKEKQCQVYQAGKLIESVVYSLQGSITSDIFYEYLPSKHCRKEIKGDLVSIVWTNPQGNEIARQQGNLITIFDYDAFGNRISVKDILGNSSFFHFDESNRMIEQTFKDGSKINYEYDAYSNLVSCKLPNKIEWKATYDKFNKKLSEELKSGDLISQKWTYSYEKDKLKEAIDPNFLKHIYNYDDFGRLIYEQAGNYFRKFKYDLAGHVVNIEEQGNEKTVLERSYDCLGRVITEDVYLNSLLLSHIDQSWDTGKRSLKIDDHERNYCYRMGHLSDITSSGVHLHYAYNQSGLLQERQINDINISYDYPSTLFPERITTKIKNKECEETLKWNRLGKMSSHSFNIDGNVNQKSFTYDFAGRLKSVNEDFYGFDFHKLGNGVLTNAPEYEISEKDLDPFGKIIREYIQEKSIETSYDHLGQVIKRQSDDKTQRFKWDPWGRLIEVSSEDSIWKASYDPLGRRIQTKYQFKDNPEEITTSYFDPENEFEEIGVKYEGKTFWKFGSNNCEAISDDQGNVVSLHYNALGHLFAVVDSENIHWSDGLISPYGPRGPPLNIEPSILSFANSHQWRSRRVDQTGYIWMGARYYDPLGAKFLSTDPVGIPISLDLYAYANGDPINFFDEDGRFATAVYDSVKSFGNFMGNVIKNEGVGGILQLPGQMVSLISHHLVPIPGVKDILEFGGWCLQGKHPATYKWNENKSQLVIHDGKGAVFENIRYAAMNGILVTLEEFKNRIKQYSEYNGDTIVYGIYNGTNGLILDLVEVLCQKIGIPVEAQIVAENSMRYVKSTMGVYENSGLIFTQVHSQGAETAYNLSLGVRNSMSVTALAPARILQISDFQEATNYIGAWDPVPWTDFIGMIKGLKNGNVHYIKSSGCPLIDHLYENKAFQEIRSMSVPYKN